MLTLEMRILEIAMLLTHVACNCCFMFSVYSDLRSLYGEHLQWFTFICVTSRDNMERKSKDGPSINEAKHYQRYATLVSTAMWPVPSFC